MNPYVNRRSIVISFYLLSALSSFAQSADTVSLLHALTKGTISGHARYFFMNTINEKGLTSYYANAAGAGLRYKTADFHGFQFVISGFSTFNIGSSDLTKPDKLTGAPNRYEIGLFDITDPAHKIAISRIDELQLTWHAGYSFIRVGRQCLNTPFINPEDGRMSPTDEEGAWAEMKELKKISIHLGWLWRISPRSTGRWYDPGASIGIYPSGVNPNGSKSGYPEHVQSKGVGILEVQGDPLPHLRLLASGMLVENIYFSSLLQAEYTLPLQDSSSLFAGAQTVRQFAVAAGGNPDPSKAYFTRGGKSSTIGARAGWRSPSLETSINYNRITPEGRYLSPREWGFEPFFTFLAREKSEGIANAYAVMMQLAYRLPGQNGYASVSAGYYHQQDVKDYKDNKYGFPSYTQLNFELRHSFARICKGLEADLLLVGKIKEGNSYGNDRFIINKVNMMQTNFVLNYSF